MSPEILTARLQTACHWEWMPGILCTGIRKYRTVDFRILSVNGKQSVVSLPNTSFIRYENYTELINEVVDTRGLKLSENAVKDPATRGCILAMVRKAHWAHICPSYENGVWSLTLPSRSLSASSEIEVLLLALETPI